MIQALAWGLEVGHPVAYCLIFLMLGIPLLAVILLGEGLIIDTLRERKERKNNIIERKE